MPDDASHGPGQLRLRAHSAIVAQRREEAVLNLVAGEGEAHRSVLPGVGAKTLRRTYDTAIAFLEDAVRRARIGDGERLDALRRLAALPAPGR